MAVSLSITHPLTSKLWNPKTHLKLNPTRRTHFPKPSLNLLTLTKLQAFPRSNPTTTRLCSFSSSSDGFALDTAEEEEIVRTATATSSSSRDGPVRFALWVLFWASLSLAWFATSKDANAAADSIKASGFGLRIANALRGSGWPDEAVVFAIASLPLLELRGAIPVGYWMGLKPVALTALAVLGNMVPVPFIILYLKSFASFVAAKSETASRLLDVMFKNAKAKAGPVEEFQWLGLMLFVAVPFPGTGAWTGAFIASILDMPFWSGLSANFVGVVLAGLLVNLLVNLGLKYAIATGVILFIVSTFMWTVLRNIKKSLDSSN